MQQICKGKPYRFVREHKTSELLSDLFYVFAADLLLILAI